MTQRTVWALFPVLLLLASGCTLKATVKETTDTTSNVTGTTSGRTWWNEDGLLHPEHKLTAFLALNEANVEQDLARGRGEYVTSLGALLGLPDDQQASFHSKAQKNFEALTTTDRDTQIQQVRMLAR
ncbi:MAG: DUF3015 family protein [Nitrospirota bacterium]|nr:DUF3015 family protein [Nitrospirota bacterium]MDP2383089.1 DUF3015 family protein [Nitrospirota bacterium]MDP3596539.1 DUF3015 family protein [Nitrospirota bacterium]